MSTHETPCDNLALPFDAVPCSPRCDPDPVSPIEAEICRYRGHLGRAGYASRTVDIYATHLRRWTMRLGRPAGDATARELRDYLRDLASRVQSSTLSQVRSALHLHYAAVAGRPSLAEIVRGMRPGRDSPARALDAEQLWRLIRAARGSRERLFVVLPAQAGLRAGEMLELRVRDIDFTTRSLRLPAPCGHVHRVVPFPPGVGLDLADEIRGRFPHQWVFPGIGGRGERPLTARTLQKTLARLSHRAGIRPAASPRVLRRTFAADLVRRGMEDGELARRLGLRAGSGVRRYLAGPREDRDGGKSTPKPGDWLRINQ